MCGISGIFHLNQEFTERGVRAMNATQSHRGPDDEGVESFTLPGGILTLGQRRLAILDLSPAGHQPMQNPASGDWIVFNGEIYNFPQLRQELTAAGAHTRPTLRNLYFRRRRLFSDLEMLSFGLRADELGLNEDFMPPEVQPNPGLLDDNPQAAISILESRFYMGNTLLRDTDVFSMAHGRKSGCRCWIAPYWIMC